MVRFNDAYKSKIISRKSEKECQCNAPLRFDVYKVKFIAKKSTAKSGLNVISIKRQFLSIRLDGRD